MPVLVILIIVMILLFLNATQLPRCGTTPIKPIWTLGLTKNCVDSSFKFNWSGRSHHDSWSWATCKLHHLITRSVPTYRDGFAPWSSKYCKHCSDLFPVLLFIARWTALHPVELGRSTSTLYLSTKSLRQSNLPCSAARWRAAKPWMRKKNENIIFVTFSTKYLLTLPEVPFLYNKRYQVLL